MNRGFINIILILGISAITSFGILKYIPISWLTSNDNLGTSVTTISTATKFSDFPGIYNTDFAAMNAGKIEVSTTTMSLLTGVGALSSGSLTTGFTPVPVALGGTGTTSPSVYRVMLGNGDNGLTVASTTGTNGQFFTSSGAGVYPSWQTSSIDESLNYNWTGNHDFESSLTINNSTTTIISSSQVGFSTSSPQANSISIEKDVYIDTGGLGIGIATTTDDNLEVAGTTLISGDLHITGNQFGGRFGYTASSTAGDVSVTTTFTGSIPTNANFGIGEYAITDGLIQNGSITIARVGMTNPTVSLTVANTTADGAYTFSWSGANLTITEDTDVDNDSSISFTIFWYK